MDIALAHGLPVRHRKTKRTATVEALYLRMPPAQVSFIYDHSLPSKTGRTMKRRLHCMTTNLDKFLLAFEHWPPRHCHCSQTDPCDDWKAGRRCRLEPADRGPRSIIVREGR